MTTKHGAHTRWSLIVVALVTLALVLPAPVALGVGQILGGQGSVSDFDARTGQVNPTASQKSAVSTLGASATWNRFGTPHSLIKYGGYLATVGEPWADFPGASEEEDARRLNAFIEAEVLQSPEQYYWLHKRFKTRPPGEKGVY